MGEPTNTAARLIAAAVGRGT